ncbi:hypothetical protein K1719_018172 [Acacia pycnantha]|nr:hypothetical protein K1719_018172 [Acacia pycnantha]
MPTTSFLSALDCSKVKPKANTCFRFLPRLSFASPLSPPPIRRDKDKELPFLTTKSKCKSKRNRSSWFSCFALWKIWKNSSSWRKKDHQKKEEEEVAAATVTVPFSPSVALVDSR